MIQIILANKVHPEYDFGSIMCMGEYLHNIEVGIMKRDFNTNPYKESPQAKFEPIMDEQISF